MHAFALPPNVLQYVIGGSIAILLMAFRMRRMTQARPLKIEQLWIVPAIFAAITAVTFTAMPPTMSDAPWLIGAALLGAVIGWYRGKTMRITVDPETHALNQAASPTALIFLLVIFGIRYIARYTLSEEAGTWGISVNLLTDAPLLLVVTMFALTRVEMFIRASRLLREARAAKAARTGAPSA